ncbi:MAG: ExbD/TolR family protein, partial [Puniceicoccales bacterium]
IVLIAFMLTLLGSRFVFAPGSQVALEEGLVLPESSMEQLTGVPTVDVLTLLQEDRLIYRGKFMSLETWTGLLAEGDVAARKENNAILLVKADARVTLQAFLRISDRAREAGYTRVQIAERPRDTSNQNETFTPAEPAERFQ